MDKEKCNQRRVNNVDREGRSHRRLSICGVGTNANIVVSKGSKGTGLAGRHLGQTKILL